MHFPNASTNMLSSLAAPTCAYLRLLTLLLPVNGFKAPLPRLVGKVIEFFGLRARSFFVFFSLCLRWGFLVEALSSTSMSRIC